MFCCMKQVRSTILTLQQVNLALSNAAPSMGGEPPPMRPLKIEFDYGRKCPFIHTFLFAKGTGTGTDTTGKKSRKSRRHSVESAESVSDEEDSHMRYSIEMPRKSSVIGMTSINKKKEDKKEPPKNVAVLATNVHQGTTSSTYSIPRYSIPSSIIRNQIQWILSHYF
jgi:hypothetical protein